MHVDVVTIFPAYFDVLDLSLLGKARRDGALELAVHDLRDFTHDRHRTVDDTPYGGGPGMLMRPEPWGAALDSVRAARDGDDPAAGGPEPGGRAVHPASWPRSWPASSGWSSPAAATRASTRGWPRTPPARFRVREVSLGDYVLNGGEVAALAVIEAVGRLLPGVVGNADSLTDESHADGLLEAPAYTKPATWRGRDVPGGAARRATTEPSPVGGGMPRCAARRRCGPTSSSGSMPSSSTTETSTCSPSAVGAPSTVDFGRPPSLWQTRQAVRRVSFLPQGAPRAVGVPYTP